MTSTLMKYGIRIIFLFLSINCFSIDYPICTDTNILIEISEKNYYTVGYVEKYKQPLWCQYILTSNELLSSSNFKRTDNFRQDKSLQSKSSKPSDYNNSGFDKGHLCPAQDRSFSLEAISETFLMSNMSPQEPSFNRGVWKRLEDKTRIFASKKNSVTIITGPILFHRYMSLTNSVAIPHMYYKIIIDNDELRRCVAFVIPNQSSELDLEMYCVPVCFVEALTGLQFNFTDDIYKKYINYYMLSNF